jgi:hypothetical protein
MVVYSTQHQLDYSLNLVQAQPANVSLQILVLLQLGVFVMLHRVLMSGMYEVAQLSLQTQHLTSWLVESQLIQLNLQLLG